MRGRAHVLRAMAALALASGSLLLGLGAPVARGADAQIKLDPTHGDESVPFTATYSVALRACEPATVTFSWDQKPFGDAALQADCTATLTMTPPKGAALGRHLVDAGFCDAFACHPATTVVYIVDPPPDPTPTPEPTATPTPEPKVEPTAEPTPTVTPKATPTPTAKPTSAPTPTPKPKPTPTATPAPTSTPSLTPSPSLPPAPTAAASAAPTGAVLGATGAPIASPSEPPSVVAGAATGGGTGGDGVWPGGGPPPALVAAVRGPEALSSDVAVLGTNLILTLVVLVTFGLTSSLFNSTIKSNRDEIDGWLATAAARTRVLRAPFGAVGALAGGIPGRGIFGRPLRLVMILGITGVVYGFLSPDFGWDGRSAVLFASIVLGVGFVTYLSEGGGAAYASRRLHAPASVRLYVAAVLIAIACVVVSRLMDFQPGILYGFVASNLILSKAVLDRRQEAQLVLLPTIALLIASLLAWLAIPFVRAMLVAEPAAWWPALVEAALVTVFVAGIEGVFYAMIPISFMDGATVFEWNRLVWMVLFGIATFLFWHLLLNQNDSYLDALRQTRVAVALGLVLLYGAVTLGTWLFFRLRSGRGSGTAAVAA